MKPPPVDSPAPGAWLSGNPSRGAPRDASSSAAGDVSPSAGDLRGRLGAHAARNPARPAAAANAPDPGKILARVARTDGTELRVSLHEYQGKPFVRVAPWQSSAADAWPVKGKGCTVKVRELSAVAGALVDALETLERQRGGDHG